MKTPITPPNVVFVFADQWRQQACGYTGNRDVQTPHLDALVAQSLNLTQATSGWPVCSPYRASLLTGQYPLSHGVFINDVPIGSDAVGLGQAFAEAGYNTGYIGKWHVNGGGRAQPIPPARRLGFEHWQVLECTHDYRHSAYYEGDSTQKKFWDGYDARAQTRSAQRFLAAQSSEKPFLLVLSWGPPHDPYETAPSEFAALYESENLTLAPNVPPEFAAQARRELAGYYAHCSALDACLGELLETLDQTGLAHDTIFVFTSDHGDMLGSHGQNFKQRPWEESVRVPFLLRFPRRFGTQSRDCTALINSLDIMPTLLSLCGKPVPETVEGFDFSGALAGGSDPSGGAALLACFAPFGQFTRDQGGREFRGVRTARHTYVRDLNGPWLLYDNQNDPFQQHNLAGRAEFSQLAAQLQAELQRKLSEQNDAFLSGDHYVAAWNYAVDASGSAPTAD